ncbi:MAG TPA: endonuclease III [Candidatus Thermoplasmatota archaeon]
MPREPLDVKKRRAAEILKRLEHVYPDSTISLTYGNNVQLLVAVMLSAQCTDAMVNKVTAKLFQKYKTVDDFARADRKTFEQEIRSTGFYRNKAKAVIAAAKSVRDRFGGEVPSTMDELDSIPGVARKTANVVLHHAFQKAEGIAVDTHVTRIANLLRLTRKKDPVKIEQDLQRLIPQQQWGLITQLIIDHGRAICIARRPQCENCVLNELCPSARRPVDAASTIKV